MKKTFVLDTSVLLHDPQSLFAFEDNTVIVPIAVIEEVDGHKRRLDDIGRNARRVSYHLDQLRQKGKLNKGVKLGPEGGEHKVELNHQAVDNLPVGFDKIKADNRILAVALALQQEKKVPQPVILVTKDINMRVKADSIGLKAEDFERDKVDIEELYSGYAAVQVPAAQIDGFYAASGLPVETVPVAGPLMPNQFLVLEDSGGSSKSALARVSPDGKRLVPLRYSNADVSGIRARNKEQRFAIELLMDDQIKLVTLVGRAGTGKTLLALAAGVQKVMEEGVYRKLLVSRPVVPMGNDLGFLPGDLEEKLRPWMQPLYDNMEFIFSSRDKKEKLDQVIENLREMNLLDLEALTYIRGRSIPGQFFVLDEAQNLSPKEIKTVITRVGEGTKIVLTGDPYQIDNPYLDSSSSGLNFLVERFKQQPIAGHITLVKGERSDLAEMAAGLL